MLTLKSKIFRPFVIFVLIFFFILLVYFCLKNFIIEKDTYIDVSENSIYHIETSRSHDFLIYGKYLLVVNNEKMRCINKLGSVVWELDLSFNNPIVKIAGNYIVIAEQDGTNVMLVSKGKVLCDFNTSGSIFTVDINEKGFFAVVESESGYKNKLSVYNSAGEGIYIWKVSSGYILTSDISKNGKFLAVSMVDTSDYGIRSTLALVDINSASLVFSHDFDDRLYLSLKFNSGRTFSAVGDVDSICFNGSGKLMWKIDYYDRQLQNFIHNNGENTVLAFHNGSNTSTIESYSPAGNLRGSIALDFSVNNLDSVGYKVVSSSERELILSNHKGKVRRKFIFSNDFHWKGISSDGSFLFLVSGNNVLYIKL